MTKTTVAALVVQRSATASADTYNNQLIVAAEEMAEAAMAMAEAMAMVMATAAETTIN